MVQPGVHTSSAFSSPFFSKSLCAWRWPCDRPALTPPASKAAAAATMVAFILSFVDPAVPNSKGRVCFVVLPFFRVLGNECPLKE